MSNKLIPLILALVVGIILTGSMLVPIVNEFADDQKAVYNNSTGYMANAMDGDGVLVVDTTSGSTVVTFNDVVVPITTGIYAQSDKFVVFGSSGTTRLNDTDGAVSNISPATTLTITFTSGSATLAYGDVEKTYELGWAFVCSGSDGAYRSYSTQNSTATYYLNNIDQLYGSNWITTTSEWFSYHGANVIVGDEQITANYTLNEVSGYTNLYTLKIGGGSASEYNFVVDNDGEDYTVNPRFMIVPASITAIKEDGAAALALIEALPIVVIIALVVMAAGALYTKRDD